MSVSGSLLEAPRPTRAPSALTPGVDPVVAILQDPTLSMGEKLLLIEGLFAHDSAGPSRPAPG